MKSLILMSTILVFFCAGAWADETFLRFDEIRKSQSYPAYIDIIDTLELLKADSKYENKNGEFRTFDFRESVYHISKLRKAKTTLVFIHGLYGGANQFDSFFRSMNENGSDSNAILLTLPGHYKGGTIDKPIKEATKDDWIEAVHQTLKIANVLSDHVVVVGQSTGGLLATYSAIHFSNLTDGIILLEPALKVHKRIDIATCLGKHLVREAHSLSFVAKLIGMEAPKGISVSMGCEVAKLASLQLDRKFIAADPYEISQGPKEEPLEQAMSRLAAQIKIPVLLVNNLSDHVVDPKYNRIFAGLLNSKMYLEINSDGKTKHGSSDTLKTSYKDNPFYKFTCDYLVQNFAERNCARIYYEEKMRPYIFPTFVGMPEKEIKDTFLKIKEDHVSEVMCKVFDKNFVDSSLCLRFKDMIQAHIQFWHQIWNSYQANPNGHKSFHSFLEEWRKGYSEDDSLKIKRFSDSAEYFKNLLQGVSYYDLGYIYAVKYERYQNRLNFILDLEKEKDELRSLSSSLKGKFSNEDQRSKLSHELTIKIPDVSFANVHDALMLIEQSHQIDEELAAQKAFLANFRKYLERVHIAKNSKVNAPDELAYIMKNYYELPDESRFKFGFNITKVKAVITYLLKNQ